MVLSAGALPPLLDQLKEGSKVSMLRNATWTLSNFCRGKPPPNFSVVRLALCTQDRISWVTFAIQEAAAGSLCIGVVMLCVGIVL